MAVFGPAKCENCHNEKRKCHKCVEKTLCIVAVFIPGLCIETRLEMPKNDTTKEINQLKNESTKNKQEIKQIKKELNAANVLLKKDVQMLQNDTTKRINQSKSEITKNKQEIEQIKKRAQCFKCGIGKSSRLSNLYCCKYIFHQSLTNHIVSSTRHIMTAARFDPKTW